MWKAKKHFRISGLTLKMKQRLRNGDDKRSFVERKVKVSRSLSNYWLVF